MNHGQFYKADRAGRGRPSGRRRDLRRFSRRACIRPLLRRHVHRDAGGEDALARGPLPGYAGTGDRAVLRRSRRPKQEAVEHRRDGDEVLLAGRHRHGLDRHHPAGLLRAHAGRLPRVRRRSHARTRRPASPISPSSRRSWSAHPNGGRVILLLQKQPAVVSFAQVSYRPLHTYYFVNAAGAGRWARYHWEPEAGVAGQPLEELAKQPHDYLYEELEGRLRVRPGRVSARAGTRSGGRPGR